MPATEWGWLITPAELRSWIIDETADVLVVNKPPFIVCHPSKHGPWSSLVGACREYLGLERVHIPCRLDRETSGVVVVAKNRAAGSLLQRAAERRRVRKTYWAVLSGALAATQIVSQPIDRDPTSPYACRQGVSGAGRDAETEFIPVLEGGGYTLARVYPRTGRLHQIRVHASWLGHAIAGDKLYGPDPALMLEYVTHGFTPRLAAALPLNRHALHAAELTFCTKNGEQAFRAPFPEDLSRFCCERLGISPAALRACGAAHRLAAFSQAALPPASGRAVQTP